MLLHRFVVVTLYVALKIVQLRRTVADPKIFKGGRKTIYHSPFSFIANAYNDLYAFHAAKSEPIGQRGQPPPSPSF